MKKKTDVELETQTLKRIAELWAEDFGARYPSKTINHHHYIRRRNLEKFLFDFALMIKERKENENKPIIV